MRAGLIVLKHEVVCVDALEVTLADHTLVRRGWRERWLALAGATRGGGIVTVAVAVAILWMVVLRPTVRTPSGELHVHTGRVEAVDKKGQVVFSYQVHDRTYYAQRVWPTIERTVDRADGRLPEVGKRISIMVDPYDPSHVRLCADTTRNSRSVACLAGMLALVGLRSSFTDEQDEEPTDVPMYKGTTLA